MLERKGLVPRLIAAIIDGLIVGIAASVAMRLGVVGVILAGLIYIAYPAIELLKAQSPGKMIMKFKVTMEDGSPANRDHLIQRGLLRWGPFVASGVFMLLSIIPVLGILAALANLVVAVGYIVLVVLSLKPMKATNQAIWDVRARTAVMGPVGSAIPALATQPASPTPPPHA
ncbi:RDD family protein [Humisphaera borealis]|uniref:RDD family protein n=1 Tax=Humisphaera borealis TaxID=2807512 RepID=A0A7M2WUW8_9BACT|nr:RDD family protein [Humisphaera borealis]QOV88992.1 RDD family protein [Humisphaera borealis]